MLSTDKYNEEIKQIFYRLTDEMTRGMTSLIVGIGNFVTISSYFDEFLCATDTSLKLQLKNKIVCKRN